MSITAGALKTDKISFAGLRVVYQGDSGAALNRAYERVERQFGGYCSNWEWFQSNKDVKESLDEVWLRIEQN